MMETTAPAADAMPLGELLDLRRRLPPPKMRRALREAHDLSGAQMAGAMKVSRQAISHWERGTRSPRPEHLRAYVELLEMLARNVGEASGSPTGATTTEVLAS